MSLFESKARQATPWSLLTWPSKEDSLDHPVQAQMLPDVLLRGCLQACWQLWLDVCALMTRAACLVLPKDGQVSRHGLTITNHPAIDCHRQSMPGAEDFWVGGPTKEAAPVVSPFAFAAATEPHNHL